MTHSSGELEQAKVLLVHDNISHLNNKVRYAPQKLQGFLCSSVLHYALQLSQYMMGATLLLLKRDS